jgi:ElaB/YqjD/DUF883 family membrane-anchored ribosome-binding protein
VFDTAVSRLSPYVEQAGDYVGPIAHRARTQTVKLAAETYDRAHPLLEDAAKFAVDSYDRVQPRLEEAARRGARFAADTYERVQPALDDVRVKGARIAADTLDKVQPRIEDALDRVSPAVDDVVGRVQPAVDEAFRRVGPAVDAARDKVQYDLLPRFSAALHEAADHPLAKETTSRMLAATAALKGDLELPPEKKKAGVGRRIAQVALIGAAVAGVVVAAKKLFGKSDTGWETHEPSKAYVADPVADVVEDVTAAADEAAEVVEEAAETATEATGDAVASAVDAAAEAADQVTDEAVGQPGEAVQDVVEGASAEAEAGDDAAPLAVSPYGEGSYVGAEPPEGYDIKGNERSKKFHVQGTGGYERTIADVWFNSHEAAERAGFVKAQR